MATNLDLFLQELSKDKEFQSSLKKSVPSSKDTTKFETFIDSPQFDKVLTSLSTAITPDVRSQTIQRIGQELPGVVSPTATRGQAIGQAITTPIRGVRGLAVGAERLTRGTGLARAALLPGTAQPSQFLQAAQQAPQALERAAAAVEPGFTPEDIRERVASDLATAAAVTLFTAPLGGVGATGRLAQAFKAVPQFAKSALLGGSAAAITNAVDQGEIEAIDVGLGAFIGGAALPLIGGTVALTGRFTRSLTRLFGSGVLRDVSPASIRAIEQTPFKRILQNFTKDPIKVARRSILNVQLKAQGLHQKVSNELNTTRAKIGLGNIIDEDIVTASPDFTPANANNLVEKFRILTLPTTQRTLNAPALLRELTLLKQNMREFVSFAKSSGALEQAKLSKSAKNLFGNKRILDNSINKIDRIMGDIPGGTEQMIANRKWSLSKKLYENVTKKLADKKTGPNFLKKIILGDNMAELALPGSELNMLRSIERRTGTRFIQDLKTDIAILDADDATITGRILGLVSQTVGAKNTALAVRGGEVTANLAASLSNLIQAPITTQMLSSVLAQGQRQ